MFSRFGVMLHDQIIHHLSCGTIYYSRPKKSTSSDIIPTCFTFRMRLGIGQNSLIIYHHYRSSQIYVQTTQNCTVCTFIIPLFVLSLPPFSSLLLNLFSFLLSAMGLYPHLVPLARYPTCIWIQLTVNQMKCYNDLCNVSTSLLFLANIER